MADQPKINVRLMLACLLTGAQIVFYYSPLLQALGVETISNVVEINTVKLLM